MDYQTDPPRSPVVTLGHSPNERLAFPTWTPELCEIGLIHQIVTIRTEGMMIQQRNIRDKVEEKEGPKQRW